MGGEKYEQGKTGSREEGLSPNDKRTDTNQKAGLENWTPQQVDGTSETQEPNQARDQFQYLHWQQERSSKQLSWSRYVPTNTLCECLSEQATRPGHLPGVNGVDRVSKGGPFPMVQQDQVSLTNNEENTLHLPQLYDSLICVTVYISNVQGFAAPEM